jgi:hypothetical protein
MHMISIVQMLYLSSKSLFLQGHRDEDEGYGYGGGRTCLTAPGLLSIEIAMGDGHLISQC